MEVWSPPKKIQYIFFLYVVVTFQQLFIDLCTYFIFIYQLINQLIYLLIN